MEFKEYSSDIDKFVENIYTYYDENPSFEFLQKIMDFTDKSIDLIDENLFFITKEELNKFREKGREIWKKDGDPEKLREISNAFHEATLKHIEFKELMKKTPNYGAFVLVSWYLSNLKDDPCNQFPYDFLELVVFEINKSGVKEDTVKELLLQYFKEFEAK